MDTKPTSAEFYGRLVSDLRAQADFGAALHLLQWDQETYLPPGGGAARARQIGTLAAALHERRTDARFLDLVDELASHIDELAAPAAIDVRETKWHLDRERVLDADLVRERSVLHAKARSAWIGARADDDFGALLPYLERIIDIERRVAHCIDSARDPYEVLLEGYEPGLTVAQLEACFTQLRKGLQPLIDGLRPRPSAETSALEGDFPLGRQREFGIRVAKEIGFDFDRGRLDIATHPFSMSVGDDVRLTTRYDPNDLRESLYSTIHEAGHGLYEQGLDPDAWGLPRGRSCSLGVHESQSRLWENIVGRSRGFWQYFLPIAQQTFTRLRDTSLAEVLRSVNAVGPSLIRTDADEITYNMHIVLRYDLERALIAGTLAANDLPGAWREGMAKLLGVTPTTDREGVLQDVHWASGAIGYFPTYTLGNVYAAELAASAEETLGPLPDLLARGDFIVLLDWLRLNVHRHGQSFRGHDLIARVIGREPTPAALISHLEEKLRLLAEI